MTWSNIFSGIAGVIITIIFQRWHDKQERKLSIIREFYFKYEQAYKEFTEYSVQRKKEEISLSYEFYKGYRHTIERYIILSPCYFDSNIIEKIENVFNLMDNHLDFRSIINEDKISNAEYENSIKFRDVRDAFTETRGILQDMLF
ncbi:MAG TPA: hypothetical protein DCX03_11915 [Bacteroidales bacterium]|nr:hypothetical protein [Bacteroidales bacterium]